MEWRRLKNIIILILLLVNGFLLVLVGARRGEALQYDREALEYTIGALGSRGISVDTNSLSPSKTLSPLGMDRDLDAELKLAQALLGQGSVQAENRGGGLYRYENGNGGLTVRSGGELSAEMADNPSLSAGGSPERHAAELLRKMGIDAEQVGVTREDEWTRVRFRQLWDGVPVFSCEVEFVYCYDTLLYSVQGTLLTAQDGTAESTQAMTLPTALMRFLDGITATGDVCSSIRSMEAGYRATPQSLSGGVRLTPVWLISSDTADYYLDGITGALTRITDQ